MEMLYARNLMLDIIVKHVMNSMSIGVIITFLQVKDNAQFVLMEQPKFLP